MASAGVVEALDVLEQGRPSDEVAGSPSPVRQRGRPVEYPLTPPIPASPEDLAAGCCEYTATEGVGIHEKEEEMTDQHESNTEQLAGCILGWGRGFRLWLFLVALFVGINHLFCS